MSLFWRTLGAQSLSKPATLDNSEQDFVRCGRGAFLSFFRRHFQERLMKSLTDLVKLPRFPVNFSQLRAAGFGD